VGVGPQPAITPKSREKTTKRLTILIAFIFSPLLLL
jgi:hypothetical protein